MWRLIFGLVIWVMMSTGVHAGQGFPADAGMIVEHTGEQARYYPKKMLYPVAGGGEITILISRDISSYQALRAYGILGFYLDQLPLKAGQKIAQSDEVYLLLVDGRDGESPMPEHALIGQPLYDLETPLVGSRAYMYNDWEYRDAAFEEILHFVHDHGIGVKYQPGAVPKLQAAIDRATTNALRGNLWGRGDEGVRNWIDELSDEGSLSQEYLASIVDSYYGLWGAFPEPGGMWGIYIAKGREDIKQLDPMGFAVIEGFLPPYLDYWEQMSPEFVGEFYMRFDPKKPYTHKAQYLKKIKLNGTNAITIIGNDAGNAIMAHQGDVDFRGGLGEDTLYIDANSQEFTVTRKALETLLVSNTGGQRLRLEAVEFIHFRNEVYDLR